jgi:predicted nucleic acid-binding protein
MKWSDILEDVSQIGVDTSLFIYLIERHPVYLSVVRPLFERASNGHLRIVTSVVSLIEILTLPLAQQKAVYVSEYREMLLNTNSIVTLPIGISIAERAAELRARFGLRTPDAIQIAAALDVSCSIWMTNDRQLKRVTDLRVITLDEIEPVIVDSDNL